LKKQLQMESSMKLRVSIFFILLGMLITACGGASKPKSNAATHTEVSRDAPPTLAPTPTLLSPGDLQLTTNCTVVSRRPTPGPTEQSLFPPVDEDDWVKGEEDAPVTIIEYSDFQ
jgi:hypothetical protein